MAKASDNSQTSGPANKRSFLRPIYVILSLTTSVILYLFFSIIVNIVVEWVGMSMNWWNDDHILLTMKADLNYLGSNFTTSVFGLPPQELALNIARYINFNMSIPDKFNTEQFEFMRNVQYMADTVRPYWQTVIYSTISVAVRALIIVMSSVLFIIVTIVACVDGLVERELRKDGGGIEHGSLYHHSKTWVGRVLVISPAIYLAWPDAINPALIIFPSALAYGFTVYLTFSTFKKYL